MKQQGVTLIEMMIVVVVIALLALAASPFTGAWVKEADITKTLAILEQSVGSAKASALRNPTGEQGQNPVVALCVVERDLRLVAAAAIGDCPAAGALWSARLPAGVTITTNAQAWTCSCFTNRGLLTTAEASCNACSSSLVFTVSAGANIEPTTLTIH